MGSWFSNFHVRKNGTISRKDVSASILEYMSGNMYIPVKSQDEADVTVAILIDEKSQWYTVCSDFLSFDDPKQFAEFAKPMSQKCKTDVLGISCFDSDFLALNWIDVLNHVDAWAGVGSAAGLGIRRRTNLSAWKHKVSDFSGFKENIRKRFVFAEEVLAEIEHCIQLPQKYAMATFEYLSELYPCNQTEYFYFKLTGDTEKQEKPKLIQNIESLTPCFIGKPALVKAINVGGESKGLSVYFVGSYVENDDITFSEVSFVKSSRHGLEHIPIELQKVQLADGQWAYYYHDPVFKIFPKVDERLPAKKRMDVESAQSIVVRFVPQGDPRKILDITVVLSPDKNPEGQTGWNVWYRFGSKKKYIESYNTAWSKYPEKLLQEEDYD